MRNDTKPAYSPTHCPSIIYATSVDDLDCIYACSWPRQVGGGALGRAHCARSLRSAKPRRAIRRICRSASGFLARRRRREGVNGLPVSTRGLLIERVSGEELA